MHATLTIMSVTCSVFTMYTLNTFVVHISYILAFFLYFMTTSSNGNIFRVTSLLWGESTSQRPMKRSFDVFFDLRLNKRLSKQSRHRWFETPSCSLLRHCDVFFENHPLTWTSSEGIQTPSTKTRGSIAIASTQNLSWMFEVSEKQGMMTAWKPFQHFWPYFGEIIPKRARDMQIWYFSGIGLIKQLNNRCSCQRLCEAMTFI